MDTPLDQPVDPVRPQTTPQQEGAEPRPGIVPGSHPPPPPKGGKQRKECRPDQTPWWKHLLELAAVLLGIAVAWIYWNQLIVMSGQLGEIIRQYPELQKSANAAKDAAKAAQDNLTLTTNNAHIDQRAWVGLADIKMKFDEGSYPEISFTFVDSGKTPAREVTTQVYWKASGTMAPDCKGTDWRPFHAPSIPPQGKYILHNPIDNPWYTEDLSQNQYWTKFEGASFVCVFGEISYADIFSEARHTTKFCVYAYPSSPDKFTYCPKSNGMD